MQCYSLFREDVNRLNIEIIYNKKTFTNALILFKVKIVYNGSIDIDKNRIFKPLKIISSKEFTWLETRKIEESNGSISNIKIVSPHDLQIEWDLLKTNEYIEFEALIEIIDGSKLDNDKTTIFYNGLYFDFRITDLSKITKENRTQINPLRKYIAKYEFILYIINFPFGLFLILNNCYPPLELIPPEGQIILNMSNGTSHIKGSINLNSNNGIRLNVLDTNQRINLPVDDFNKKYKINTVYKADVSKSSFYFQILSGGLLIIASFGLFYLYAKDYKKNKRKRNNRIVNQK